MNYKIGEVAKLLGMTTEGIRYYENSGIINPQKQDNSNIRHYNAWDIHMLVRVRSYSQIGFSLADISNMINHQDEFELDAALANSEEAIQAEIIHKLNILKYVRQIKSMTKTAQEMLGKYRIEYSPAFYRLEMEEGYILNTTPFYETLIHEWIAKAPFVFTSALFPKAELDMNEEHYTIGFAIKDEFAEYLKVEENEYVKYYPSRLCVNTTIESNSAKHLSPKILKEAIQYIHSQGLSLTDDVFSRVVMIHKDQNIYGDLHQVWLPVH